MDSQITTEATQDFSTLDSAVTQRKLSLSEPWTAQPLQNPSEISAPRTVQSPLKQVRISVPWTAPSLQKLPEIVAPWTVQSTLLIFQHYLQNS